MKLLLTSAGLSNVYIAKALKDLIGPDKLHRIHRVAFIPTAANVEEGDKSWLIKDFVTIQEFGYEVDIVDISALPKDVWLPRLQAAKVLFFGGGNTFHLMHWMKKSGLTEILPTLLKTRVYAGISAGSCIAGPTIFNSVQNLFGEKYDLKEKLGLNLVDFQIIPHLDSPYFKNIREENLKVAAEHIDEQVYVLDDNSAIKIDGHRTVVVGQGKHLIINPNEKN